MDNLTIEKVLKNHPKTQKNFQGVYSIDQLPKKKNFSNKKTFLVVNIDPSYKRGSHWVALMIDKNGKNIYFDSYGLPPQKYIFKKYLGKNYTYSKKQVQHPLSTTCGQWCIFLFGKKIKEKN